MVKTRSITRNQNQADTPAKKRSKTIIDKGYSSPWLGLNHDVLFLVMMQLGVIDFLSFSGVCKSWRAFARSNKETFMTSRLPMQIWICDRPYKKECYLEDHEGRNYKTLLSHSGGRTCVGVTCGYLVLFGRKTSDFWLVNPITRNELHFPASPFAKVFSAYRYKAILVFSPILSEYILVMTYRFSRVVWFSVAGKKSWNRVSSTFDISDLFVFKGKIYISATNTSCLYEIRLYPDPKLVLLHETKNSLKRLSQFVSSGGNNLYVTDHSDFYELNFVKKEWVGCEKIKEEYAFFVNNLAMTCIITAIKPESWDKHHPRYGVGSSSYAGKKGEIYGMWYFPHECFNVDLMDE